MDSLLEEMQPATAEQRLPLWIIVVKASTFRTALRCAGPLRLAAGAAGPSDV